MCAAGDLYGRTPRLPDYSIACHTPLQDEGLSVATSPVGPHTPHYSSAASEVNGPQAWLRLAPTTTVQNQVGSIQVLLEHEMKKAAVCAAGDLFGLTPQLPSAVSFTLPLQDDGLTIAASPVGPHCVS